MVSGIEPDADGFRRQVCLEHGFAVGLPAGWEVYLDTYPGVALVGLAPQADEWGFRTNVVVTVERLEAGTTLETWQANADQLLPQTLAEYLLLDLEQVQVGEHRGIRRLAHHAADGRAVTMEQWTVLEAGGGFSLTASTSTLGCPALAGRLAEIAGTFGIDIDLMASQTDSRD